MNYEKEKNMYWLIVRVDASSLNEFMTNKSL